MMRRRRTAQFSFNLIYCLKEINPKTRLKIISRKKNTRVKKKEPQEIPQKDIIIKTEIKINKQ